MDFCDAASEAWQWLRELQEGPHPAPAATQIREMRGQIGTGPASDDHTVSLWVNDRPVAICNLFRDVRNYTMLIRTRLAAEPSEDTSGWREIAEQVREAAAKIADAEYDRSSDSSSLYDGGAGSCGHEMASNRIAIAIRAMPIPKSP
jgi:hypothetical protein